MVDNNNQAQAPGDRGNMQGDMTEAINEAMQYSLLSEAPKKALADKLGIEPNAKAFVQWVADVRGMCIEDARRLILDNPMLMKLIFILA